MFGRVVMASNGYFYQNIGTAKGFLHRSQSTSRTDTGRRASA